VSYAASNHVACGPAPVTRFAWAVLDTLERVLTHHGPASKAIIWAHNTHVGDARATSMARRQEWNIGQLARERWGESDVVLVGFGSHRGSVIAGKSWGAEMEVRARLTGCCGPPTGTT
jgi:erythromycin esterase